MFVSGLTLQKKKYSQPKKTSLNKNHQEERPLSSEFPEIHQHKRSHQNNIMNQNQNKYRHSSSNKITFTSKVSSKKQLSQKKQLYSTNKIIKQVDSIKEFNDQGNKKTKKKLQIGKNIGNSNKILTYNQVESQKILSYFRYYPVVIIQTCGKRQEMMKSLNQLGQIQTYNPKIKKITKKISQAPIDGYDIWNKLIKLAMLKGKYRYRQKFNYNLSAQLKAFNYKRKQAKKKKQSDSSSSDEQEKKQKCRDMETWKKTMGASDAKVFIVKGKYTDFRNALLERGWIQNTDKHSSFFDLKWTTKVNDVTFQALKPNQIVNHFNNNACLTSKYGICKSLRSIMYSDDIDIDKFFPKAFDLCDLSDFQNFLIIYQWVFCESILKDFLKGSCKLQLNQIKLALVIIKRRLISAQKLVANSLNCKYNIPSINEWKFIHQNCFENIQEIETILDSWELIDINDEILKLKVQEVLNKLKDREPQYDLNGDKNIWIVKPAFLSRGRGIKCLSKFSDVLDYALGKQTQYVVQKYIENPLIIQKKKFDIRQWVIVQDYNPPKIWIYGQFYVRFCIDQYDDNKIGNKFAHLTNNSIQKYNKNLSEKQLKQQLKESMWTQEQLKTYIQNLYQPGCFKQILSKMKQIVISTILSTSDQVYGRKNSFQLIGYDFMIDKQLNPWLIEINTSPSMDYSTPVTRRLVKMVLEDTAKVVIDLHKKKTKKKTAGLFKCVYNGQTKFESKHYKIASKEQGQNV